MVEFYLSLLMLVCTQGCVLIVNEEVKILGDKDSNLKKDKKTEVSSPHVPLIDGRVYSGLSPYPYLLEVERL